MIFRRTMVACIKKFYREVTILLLSAYILLDLFQQHVRVDFDGEVFFTKAQSWLTEKKTEEVSSLTNTFQSLEEISDNLININDDDPKLLEYLRTKKIVYPDYKVKTNVGTPEMGQIGQVKEVLKYFKDKKNGVFFEAGAFNGEYLSNTLYLEVSF